MRVRRLGRLHPSVAWAAWTLAALSTVALLAPAAHAQATATTVTVERGERVITVVQRALAADGARSVLNNPNCEEGARANVFVGPPPGFVETRIDATRLTSSIALVLVPDDGDESIELRPGRAVLDRPGCIESIAGEDGDAVVLEQGRTTVTGSRFVLASDTDLAVMEGPLALRRASEDGGVTLEATADRLTLDVGTEVATLEGNVVVTSDDRVSRADRLELDEAAGVAVLTGDPAVSTRGADEIRGATLRYDLETDDVVAIGAVGARFEIDLD